MSEVKTAPYGSWKSPITSDLIVSETIGLSDIVLDDQDVYWLEMRPSEGGRYVTIRRAADGSITEMVPSQYNTRTKVHEYGGGPYAVANEVIYFSNYSDQRLYLQAQGSDPIPITPDIKLRFADIIVDHLRDQLICVCEDHSATDSEPLNTIVSVDVRSIDQVNGGRIKTLVSGSDFYASPCLSPDGFRLAWLSWNHPNMPWDGTELWMGEIGKDGSIVRPEKIAGGSDESIFQPQWSPDGILFFVSDMTGWWNLYRMGNGKSESVIEMKAEFGMPQWLFGMSTFAFESPNRIICTYNRKGIWRLASIDIKAGNLEEIENPYTDISYLRAASGKAVFIGGSATEPKSIIHYNFDTHEFEVLQSSNHVRVDPRYTSLPESIEFLTEHSRTAHAFFYPPYNKDFSAPAGERPPLLVMIHGGPTAATAGTLNVMIQFWTSRGFAVLDVNYGGSTGFGRTYRKRLNGQWGIVDTVDCVNGARHLVQNFGIDMNRMAIRGGSAGGYTTLCALTFHDVFKAGASYYGVSDLEALAIDTHKFESRYLDTLIGPYPERRDLYQARSPIHHADRLACPIIFFQGLEDKVVPPNQAETMVKILRDKGLPVAYLAFEKEQHGFRSAENIKRALDVELYFYSKIFGFGLADHIAPVEIENLVRG